MITDRRIWYDKAHKSAEQNDFWRSKAKKQVSIMHAKEKALERLESNKIEKPKEESVPAFEVINKNLNTIKLPKYLIRVQGLSMGERSRTAIAKLMLSGANLLILDDPTNYLDIASRERIEAVLQGFKGTILFVSHDRYFINNIADKIFELKDFTINTYEQSYKEYSQNKKAISSSEGFYNLNKIKDEISKLELELAFISGRLGEALEEE
ncbi:ATP-binding cassette domain-containing protein [Clostridium polynesiense]|uniref:ATP-binding cassette domain-containing protein n=1 Tax=Clostridium polynesiense TaxID=1325933 RepID=UPI00058FAF5B|nr:ATP-binding cassette domain-containing protein [Clostridium polynesiense]